VLSIAAAQAAMSWCGAALAQSPPAPAAAASEPSARVLITGQRPAQTAQQIKQDAEEVVDSVVADEIGKLPDRSVAEALQRVVGVTIDHTMDRSDPEHFSVEGSGVAIRGLPFVRSELNGRDAFSAAGGRALSFEDVPLELLAGVDVYKNPSAEQIEGAIGGLVNLRTAMPFDFDGRKVAVSVSGSRSTLRGATSPSASGLVSTRWDTGVGRIGFLVDLARSESRTRTDAYEMDPYYPRTDPGTGRPVWIPKGAYWRTVAFDRTREGAYAALQWKNDAAESALSFFKSRFVRSWDEEAIYSQSSPYDITVDPGATYDARGALLTGTLRDDADGGIDYNTDARAASRVSDTQDVSWRLSWKASERWSIRSELQLVRASTHSFDSTVGLGIDLAKEQVDLTGSRPRLGFDDADRAALVDPANYYWAWTMEHRDRGDAREKALRLDATVAFDGGVLRDLRVGMRLTEGDATTTTTSPSYNWAAITQPWQLGWDIGHVAHLDDPRFAGNARTDAFPGFFGGNSPVPALLLPDAAAVGGYPASYAALHRYHDILCLEHHGGNAAACPAWTPASFGTDPTGTNRQAQRTQAVYGQLRFGFETLALPVDGNAGLRFVRTEGSAHGYTTFSAINPTVPPGGTQLGVPVPDIADFAQAQDFRNDHDDVLPSLNLRMKAIPDLQFRLALAKAIARPDFSQLQGNTTLSQTTTSHSTGSQLFVDTVSDTGYAAGNPMLKPTRSNQVDLTAEWYWSKSGSFTVALFDKHLEDVVINQVYAIRLADTSGHPVDFTTTAPINGARGTVRGIELASQVTFDGLPGWMAGFGLRANFTFVDSRQTLYRPVLSAFCAGANQTDNLNLNLNGCDTDGRSFGNLPLPYTSRDALNLALLYDRGPVSARVAYGWRSRYLLAVNANGTSGGDATDTNPASPGYGQHNVGWALPTWAGSYGELDAGVFWKASDQVTLGLEGTNLTDSIYRELMQQHIGMKGRAWYATGRTFTLTARLSF
jgi:TonB-dependent receptor